MPPQATTQPQMLQSRFEGRNSKSRVGNLKFSGPKDPCSTCDFFLERAFIDEKAPY
jgi:hypothetical protein